MSPDGHVAQITGGTSSLGQAFTQSALARSRPRKLVTFSRGEMRQFEMQQRLSEDRYPCIRYFIGDVRDRERLYRAFDGVDVVVHAAATLSVACEAIPYRSTFTRTDVLRSFAPRSVIGSSERR